MTFFRKAIVSTVATSVLLTGAVVAVPAVASAPHSSGTTASSTGNPTLDLLVLEVQRLLLPGCLEATLSILLRQGGTPGRCLG